MDDEVRFEDDAPEALQVHPKAWSQREFLEHIAHRHFTLGAQVGDRLPAWELEEEPDATVSASIVQFNDELSELGWMARLRGGRPTVLQILPLPRGQFLGRMWILTIWAASACTLTMAGFVGTKASRPSDGVVSSSGFADAFLLTALPVLGLIALASMVQVGVARSKGVRVGPIVPVPDPSILLWATGVLPAAWLVWPFGIFVLPTLPRMDARPWPDRASLGWTALSAPGVLILGGLCLWMLGWLLTPALSSVSALPISHDPGWFLGMMDGLLRTDLATRAAWASPLVWAGATATFLAWVSLLHVPTFPGGRLHVARLGMSEVRTTQTQMLLLFAFALGAVLFSVFTRFTVWSLVLPVILTLTLLMGSDRRWPMVLDDTKPVPEQQHFAMGLVWVLLLLVALPSETPLIAHNDWDAEMTMDAPEIVDVVDVEGVWRASISMSVLNPSLLDQQVSLILDIGPDWVTTWDGCSANKVERCEVEVRAGRSTSVSLNASWNGEGAPTRGLLSVSGGSVRWEAPLQPNLPVHPLAPKWNLTSDEAGPLVCVDLTASDGTHANLSLPGYVHSEAAVWWTESGTQELSVTQPASHCLRSADPMLLKHTPPEHLSIDNTSFTLQPPDVVARLAFDDDGWNVSSEGWGAGFEAGGSLHLDRVSCADLSPEATPPRGEQGWIWDLGIRGAGTIPTVGEGEALVLRAPADGELLHCPLGDASPAIYRLERGPDVVLVHPIVERRYIGVGGVYDDGDVLAGFAPNASGTVEIHLEAGAEIPLSVVIAGDGMGWDVVAPSILANGTTVLTMTPPSTGTSSFEFDHLDGRVLLRLSSLEA
tara:strand:- start:92 stop:2569 length:2478 start_codon:yes stop_codon:yes gene_type:complete